jgi:prevent-host-death family protein
MAISVTVGYAKTHLSELLHRVEAGEEFVVSRGDVPVARLVGLHRSSDVAAAIREIKQARVGLPRTTTADILAWRSADRR